MQGLYDAIIERCLTRDSVPAAARDLLRLGAHQLLSMRVPAHAAVHSTVELAGKRAGFVNAVLRRVSERPLSQWIEELGASGDDVDALAIRTSHPAWIVRAFASALGDRKGELSALLDADNEAAPTVLAARRCSQQSLLDMPGVEPGRWSPWAGILRGNPQDLDAVRSGAVGVQDEGSQLAVLALLRAGGPVRSGEQWLDMCAGPGGKAALLAAAAEGSADLIMVEQHEHRAGLVRAAVGGFGEVLVGDARTAPWGDALFDRVLLDAPCTGLGALRRRPEARWRRTPADLAALGPLQRDLLSRGLEALRPGGVLAYVTCSPHPAETEAVVDDIAAAAGATRLDAPALLPEVPDCSAQNSLDVQLWPHRHGTDAMFISVLTRR
jgi:16S rRNA (cytosine967-C5)-methyltransferase